ncbi:MAG: hypothetical protein AAFZ07_27435 [Actinomycetota bacterium]
MTTSAEQDLFTEVTNVGGGSAATALSEMLMTRVNMGLPRTVVSTAESFVQQHTSGDGDLATCIVGVTGEITGNLIVLYGSIGAYESVLGMPDADLDSAFAEIGNILCARFLIAIGELADLFAEVTPPIMHRVDRPGLATLLEQSAPADPFTGLVTRLVIDGVDAHAQLIYLPTQDSLTHLSSIL